MNKLYDESSIQATANAIRHRGGTTALLKVEDFADAIEAIPSPEGERTVTTNGRYDIEDYKYVDVNVPTTGGDAVIIPKTITSNGTYNPSDDNADGYAPVTVNVPTEEPVLINKTISLNGSYVAQNDNADGYKLVVVDVEQGVFPEGTKTITENGTYDVTNFASALVNVSGGGYTVEVVEGSVEPLSDSYQLDIPIDGDDYPCYVFAHREDYPNYVGSVGSTYEWVGVNINRIVSSSDYTSSNATVIRRSTTSASVSVTGSANTYVIDDDHIGLRSDATNRYWRTGYSYDYIMVILKQ